MARLGEVGVSSDEILERHVRGDSCWGGPDNQEENLYCLEEGEGSAYSVFYDDATECVEILTG